MQFCIIGFGVPAVTLKKCLTLKHVGNEREIMEDVVWSTGKIYFKMSKTSHKKRTRVPLALILTFVLHVRHN